MSVAGNRTTARPVFHTKEEVGGEADRRACRIWMRATTLIDLFIYFFLDDLGVREWNDGLTSIQTPRVVLEDR